MTRTQTALKDGLIAELRGLLGDRVSTAAAVRAHHGHGEDYYPVTPPDAVCFPETTEEVASIVALCARDRVPVVPFGTGTSLAGPVPALHGGVCLDLSPMNRVSAVPAQDLD